MMPESTARRRRRRRADRGRLRAFRLGAAPRRRRGPWSPHRARPASRRRGRPCAGPSTMPRRSATSTRRLACGEPQVRPSSQRGRSSASASGTPETDMAGEQRRLDLRLGIAAHGAIGHDPPVAQHRQRRIERVQRQPPGLQPIERAAFEREAGAAVLHQHAGFRQHAAGAELPVERLDVGDDEAARRRRRPSRRCRRRRRAGDQRDAR